MSQDIILKNLLKFVKLSEKKYSGELKIAINQAKDIEKQNKIRFHLKKHQSEFLNYLIELKKHVESGMCLGFSICHTLMDDNNKLEWWEASLKLVCDWSGENLDERVFLPDCDEAITRREVFERVLNYIYFTQASSAYFKPNETKQHTILKSDEKGSTNAVLDYIDSKGVVKNIIKHAAFSGSFTIEQLEKILKPNLKKNIISLAHSNIEQHAIRIGKHRKYILYDPNYSHSSSKLPWSKYLFNLSDVPIISEYPIYKEFDTLNEMLQELIKIQGSSLAIELASFDPNVSIDLDYYHSLLKNIPHLLIKNHGLTHMVMYNPDELMQVIQSAQPMYASDIRKEIGLSLSSIKPNGLSVLSGIFTFMPHLLTLLFKLGENDPSFCDHLAKAISLERSGIKKGSHYVIFKCPLMGIIQLIKLAQESQSITKELHHMIVEDAKYSLTGLQMIAARATYALAELVKFSGENTENALHIRKAIGEALFLKNKDNETGLKYIAYLAPTLINPLIHICQKDVLFAKQFKKAIQESGVLNNKGIDEYMIKNNIHLKCQSRYARFFKPALIGAGALIGGTYGVSGALLGSTAAILVPRALESLKSRLQL